MHQRVLWERVQRNAANAKKSAVIWSILPVGSSPARAFHSRRLWFTKAGSPYMPLILLVGAVHASFGYGLMASFQKTRVLGGTTPKPMLWIPLHDRACIAMNCVVFIKDVG